MPQGRCINNAAFAKAWNNPDLTTDDIAAMFGVYRTSVSTMGQRRGLPPRKTGAKPKLAAEPFTSMWLAGVSAQQIADTLGITRNHTGTYARRLGLPKRQQGTRKVISVADFWAERMREAMAKTARDEERAQALAGLRNRPGVKAA